MLSDNIKSLCTSRTKEMKTEKEFADTKQRDIVITPKFSGDKIKEMLGSLASHSNSQ